METITTTTKGKGTLARAQSVANHDADYIENCDQNTSREVNNDENSDTFSDRQNKPDNPDIPDNLTFLNAVFHTLPDKAQITVTSFHGDPQPPQGQANWSYGTRDKVATPATANNYYCISSHYPGDDGQVKRRKSHFAALHSIVLDDIGAKVPIDRVTLAPSYIIETSPGNFQYGYILDAPIEDAGAADRLMHAIVDAGLCDPGANGATARNMRLPVAINGKAKYFDADGQPWQCKLSEWHPDHHFSVESLISGLEIELAPAGRPKREKKRMNATLAEAIDANADDVYVPRASENPVIAALQKSGFYKQPLGDGRHDITCPWVHEHTDQVDHGTAYFEPNDFYHIGGFKCQHSHGAEKRLGALLEFLQVPMAAARMKPTIRTAAGELHRIVDRMENELATTGRHYQRGGAIATISTAPATSESVIQTVSAPALTRALSAACLWERYDARSNEYVRSDPPTRHCAVLFDSQNYPHLLSLVGIARQPYLRPSGDVVATAGYDSESCLFGVFDTRKFIIPKSPTKADALAALKRLSDLLSEFYFSDEYDRAAALSLMLTAAIRTSLPHAPMIHVKAHVMGSGKSFLCKIATAIATPAPSSPVSFPENEEECGKLLLSMLLKSPAVIEFDDLSGDILPFAKLKTAITDESVSGRILGQTKEITVSTRTLILSSGNNVGAIRDMCRRVLTINIDPMCETPATRTFKRPHLLAEVKANRGQHISDCLTIVRAWHLAGRPESDIPPIASFTDWSGFCRQSLVWLGLPDPAAKMFEQMSDDPDAELLGRFMQAWQGEFCTSPAMVRDLVSNVEQRPSSELAHVVREIAEERGGQISRERLGRWIKRHEGRFIGNLRLVPEKNSRNSKAWRVSGMSGLSGYSSQPAKVADSPPPQPEPW